MYGEGISHFGEMIDIGVELELVQKSGSWFSIGEERIGQGRENAKQYLIDHPELAAQVEKDIRENLSKIKTSSRGKAALKPAGKAVDVSAEDFDDGAEDGQIDDGLDGDAD